MKDEKWILAKIKYKAEELGLKFNSKIFIVNYVTKREMNIVAYLSQSPKFNRFGRTRQQRAGNFGKFLNSEEFREVDSKGLVALKAQLMEYVKLLNSSTQISMVKNLLNGFRYDSRGYAPIVKRSKATMEHSYDILLHEWIHILLYYNKLGFYDTGGNRYKYNEGLTVFVEYYLGNYYGRDASFLKDRLEWVSKHGNKTDFDTILKYADIFIKLVQKYKEPDQKRAALVRYFREFPAPNRTKWQ